MYSLLLSTDSAEIGQRRKFIDIQQTRETEETWNMITSVGRGGACFWKRGNKDMGGKRAKREKTYRRYKERGQICEG